MGYKDRSGCGSDTGVHLHSALCDSQGSLENSSGANGGSMVDGVFALDEPGVGADGQAMVVVPSNPASNGGGVTVKCSVEEDQMDSEDGGGLPTSV